MGTLTQRLRGQYRVAITDGLGPAGGEEPDNPNEFVRTFQTPPIQHAAAEVIDALAEALSVLLDEAEGFSVSGVYFSEECMGHKGPGLARAALEKLERA